MKKSILRKLLLEAIEKEEIVGDENYLKESDKEKKVVVKGETKRGCSNCTCGKVEKKGVVKKSECGNCYKGDLFRCTGCPSLGLPPYKEGETITFEWMSDDVDE